MGSHHERYANRCARLRATAELGTPVLGFTTVEDLFDTIARHVVVYGIKFELHADGSDDPQVPLTQGTELLPSEWFVRFCGGPKFAHYLHRSVATPGSEPHLMVEAMGPGLDLEMAQLWIDLECDIHNDWPYGNGIGVISAKAFMHYRLDLLEACDLHLVGTTYRRRR